MCETKHKHYECIVAWASGKKIQVSHGDRWVDIAEPSWYHDKAYRIKPEPKPDIVTYTRVTHIPQRSLKDRNDNVKYTYDGETGNLKSVEMI